MPARNGEAYLRGLREQEREVWLRGERVRDVTTHPGLANGARAVAALYDLQQAHREEMTYVPPEGGSPVGMSFMIPRTRDDLVRRREMMLRWARASGGMMGRSPEPPRLHSDG